MTKKGEGMRVSEWYRNDKVSARMRMKEGDEEIGRGVRGMRMGQK